MIHKTLLVYHIPEAFRALLDAGMDEETGEVTEAVREELAALMRHSTEAILHLAGITREMELEASAIREIADAAQARYAALRARSQHYREFLLAAMEATGENRLADPRLEVRVRKNPPSVQIVAGEEIPPEYLRVIPESREPDKTAIRVTLKLGQPVPGCALVCTNRLEIR